MTGKEAWFGWRTFVQKFGNGARSSRWSGTVVGFPLHWRCGSRFHPGSGIKLQSILKRATTVLRAVRQSDGLEKLRWVDHSAAHERLIRLIRGVDFGPQLRPHNAHSGDA